MALLTLQRSIVDTKIRFSIVVLILATIISFGSFYAIDYLRFSFERQKMSVMALQYRAEYLARQQGISLLAAVPESITHELLPTVRTSYAQGVPVLTYHSIVSNSTGAPDTMSGFEGANVRLDTFKDQLFALKAAGWQTVSYADFEAFIRGEKQLPEKSFLLTFDDGAKESFYPVQPLLEALDYSAVMFLLPSHSLGNNSTYYLNRDEVEFMLSTGRWTVQSHGQDIHTTVPTNSEGTLQDNALSNRAWLTAHNRLETHEEYAARIHTDLATAKQHIEQAFDIPVTGFAFPFGDYGQNISNNPEAQATIMRIALQSYSLAFYQNWNRGNFTFNYPNPRAFLIKRIPVRPEWSGDDLLARLQAASPKALPYGETPHVESGWESDWGTMTMESGGMRLRAASSTTGALATLDGTYTWDEYEVEVSAAWDHGYMMLLFDVQSEQIARACVFSDAGTVQLQERTPVDIFVLREAKAPEVGPGTHTIGAVSIGTTVKCLFDGEEIINATLANASGGIGIESWDPAMGSADAIITNVSAKTYTW